MNVNIVSKDKCTGCGACYNICPKNAIKMEHNDEGFLAPKIDDSLCIDCNLCVNVCPALNTVYSNNPQPTTYAVWASDEIRKTCSSGGVFPVLAEYVLHNGGYVCGAKYDSNMLLEHVIINDKKDLLPLLGSKYLQSDTKDCFKKIKQLLDKDKLVLFCGCPCQVAGLNNFLKNKKFNNLITVDLLCHGGVAPLVFKEYLELCYPNKKISDYKFRDKSVYGWSTHANVYFKDGTEFHEVRERDLYYRAFLPCYAVRGSCVNCSYSRLPRQADITLGDFWGCKGYNDKFDDGKGTSLLFINTENGKNAIDAIKNEFKLFEEIETDFIINRTGQPFNRPFKTTNFMRDRFFFYRKYAGLEKAVEYCEQGKFDIALVGVWYGWNYGSVLTNYALYKHLRSKGLLVLMVEKPCQTKDSKDIELNPKLHSRAFAIKHYGHNISRPRMPHEMYELNDFADIFMTGSDQLWHYNIESYAKGAFLLNFVDNSHKKIAYSTSFGHDIDFTPKEYLRGRVKLFKKFDHISVREKSGVEILKNYGVTATDVIDPVFLLDKQQYINLTKESKVVESEPYICAYILDPTNEKIEALKALSQKTQLPLRVLIDGCPLTYEENKKNIQLQIIEKPSVEDWLYYMNNANLIVTDSYHGLCFSVILNKNFVVFGNRKRGLTRFQTIFDIIGHEYKMILDISKESITDQLLSMPNYIEINQRIENKVKKSCEWLDNAIYSNKVINNRAVYGLYNKCSYDETLTRTELLTKAEDNCNNIRKSLSFKMGRLVTFLPRKLRDIFKCKHK